tara:strand:- start:174 stop:482 length:309 start_codon:yes stop_codon:yes gene_type:complete
MPTVKDKITNKVISRQPYNQEGIQNAATIAESNPSWEVSNAMERTESYQLGGKVIPGQPGFGERPKPIKPAMNPLGVEQVTPSVPIPPLYEKGGKVDKYTKE